MRIDVLKAFTYKINGEEITCMEGENDVPEELAQIAAGCGWATITETQGSDKAIKRAPRTKADAE